MTTTDGSPMSGPPPYGPEYSKPRPGEAVGFFTDSTICIGCKACEVACKEWNGVPTDDVDLLAMSYDNTGHLGADTWRHVQFVEQQVDGTMRWLMNSDVCKHCSEAACLDVCPTGAIFRSEFGSVVVQDDVCNGCGYCIPACPFGVIARRELEDAGKGTAHKCTLCYDRLRGGLEPACAHSCPTKSIQFGPLEEIRGRARERLRSLHDQGVDQARLYLADESDNEIGGAHAFFLLMDEPHVYGLPDKPVTATRRLKGTYAATAMAAAALAAGILSAFLGGRR